MSQTKSCRGVSRVLAKLEESVQSGKYYEAHQKYRTLYFRYLSQKRFDECLELLYDGALKLLENDQYSSGADLGLLVVDTLEKTTVNDIDLWIHRLGSLLAKIPANLVERETLLVKSVKWSSEISKNKMGHPTMHKVIAQLMWNEGNLEQARHHFLLSKDGNGCGQMLIELSQKGFPKETDLFIAQVVLQQLCLKEIASAADTFHTYIKFHPKISRTDPPFVMPLLNFVFFLLKIIENHRKLTIFKKLCDLYKPSLDRDPSYEKYLEKIGVLFFGAPNPPQRSNNGIFGDLINQLFQGLDDEDDENQPSSSVEADLD